MRLYYCDQHGFPLPAGHKFPATKYRLLREALAADGVFEFRESPLASRDVIALAHDPAYVDAFLTGSVDPMIMRRIGFPWSEGLVRRTLGSVGGTLAAAEDALRCGIGGGLAGGTHHAFFGEGAGFCVFNDMAVCIRSLAGRVERAAVLDLDVHQGDGTAKIFEGSPDVLTISVHGRNNFPFRKQSSKLDIDLPDGCEDAPYLEAVQNAIDATIAFRPGVVFFQAGVDGLASDRLGRLGLTQEGLRQRDEMVLGAMKEQRLPCVITLGGGYSEPIELTVAAHANTFRTAARLWGDVDGR